jgi:predicted RNA binding protein YcfA (HicA-like mRNA interferase family)
MKTPRNLNGGELVKLLKKVGYEIHHQTGSHIILKVNQNGDKMLSIPNHKPVRVGTLDSILRVAAKQVGLEKEELTERFFGKK